MGLPGDLLMDKYRVERELGRGGMGMVVAARHVELDERVAIKFILPEAASHPELLARFVREARTAAKIRSEHVARVHDVGRMPNGQPYMVMEYLEGEDFEHVLARVGRLPVGEVVDYVLQAMEAIAEAHILGIVHRDLKPANLFLTRRPDGTPSVKVLDFGISKLAETTAGMARTQGLVGSPLYMSPEQLESARDVDARADIWAIGVILYELLSGRVPFDADSMPQLVVRILQGSPPPLRERHPEIPEELERIVLRCLEPLARRYSNVGELAMDLRRFGSRGARASLERITGVLSGGTAVLPLSAPPPALGVSRVQPNVASARSPSRIVALVAILAAVVAVGVAFGLRAAASGRTPTPLEATTSASVAPLPSASTDSQESPSVATSVVVTPPPLPDPPARTVATPQQHPTKSAALAKSAAPRGECAPPYYFDAEGIKHIKRGCE